MADVGQPALILNKDASPHHFALSPKQAQILQDADLVFWVAEGLTPWLERALKNIAPNAQSVELLESGIHLPMRDGAHLHDHSGEDPHAWLDPENAIIWAWKIGSILSASDPANTGVYADNTARLITELEALSEKVKQKLTTVTDIPLIVNHDAFQYFEVRYGLNVVGALQDGEHSKPSPSRLRDIQILIGSAKVSCMISETISDEKLLDVVDGDQRLNRVVVDPIGTALKAGPGLYSQLLLNAADVISGCAS